MSTDSSPGIATIVTDPDSFFRHRAENPRLLVAVGIVVLVGVLAAIATVPQANLTSEIGTGAIQSQAQGINQSVAGAFGAVVTALTVLLAFLGIVIPWVLYSAVFYLIARFAFGGDGSFMGTLALTGWGFVPTILAQIANVAANYYVFSGETLPSGTEAARNALTDLQSDPALLAASVVGIIMLVWSGVLWTYAVNHHHDLSRRNAAITVGVPVVIVLLSRLVGLI